MKRLFNLILTLFFWNLTTYSQSFYVQNSQGVTFYCYVSNKNSTPKEIHINQDPLGELSYPGDIIIPGTVIYNGEEYIVRGIGGVFWDRPEVTSIYIPNSVVYFADCPFIGCENLTKVTFDCQITEIPSLAFKNCYNLSTVNIPESVTNIGIDSFRSCYKLKSIELPNSVDKIYHNAFYDSGIESIDLSKVTEVYEQAFENCQNLVSVNLSSARSINKEAFAYCSGLEQLILPDSNSDFNCHPDAFKGCHICDISEIEMGQMQMSFNDFLGAINGTFPFFFRWKEDGSYSSNEIDLSKDETEILISDLWPDKSYRFEMGFYWNGESFIVHQFGKSTKKILLQGSFSGSNSISYNFNKGDAEFEQESLTIRADKYPYTAYDVPQKAENKITGLEPNQKYEIKFVGEKGNRSYTTSIQITTPDLKLTTLPGQALNTTTALLSSETNIDDDETNVGFEWRRHDAPSTMPSSVVYCPVDNGMLMGVLSGLNPEVYYDYRPFYETHEGNKYFGDWMTIFTGDANVFFEPIVKTYAATIAEDKSAVLTGYVLRGTEDVIDQGFEYWSTWGNPSRADGNITSVSVSGQKISCQIDDLQEGYTYSYRTFVETASGRTYGDILSFTIEGEPNGIETVWSENDVNVEIEGYYNLQGVRSDRPFKGLNIIHYTDGTIKKSILR